MIKDTLKTLWSIDKYKYYLSAYANKIKHNIKLDQIITHDDLTVYKILHSIFMKRNNNDSIIRMKTKDTIKRSSNMYDFVRTIVDIEFKHVLDIGTTDCTYIDKLNTESHATAVGINIKSFDQYSYHANTSCVHMYDGKKIPYSDNEFDVVTIMMVLHHIIKLEDQQELLEDIYRVLKIGGTLIIKEHDVSTTEDIAMVNFIHFFYELSFNDKYNIKYYNTYEATYTSLKQLTTMVEKCGFKPCDKLLKYSIPDECTRTYYLIVKK